MRAQAVGVLGGIFDPPHNGHVAIAAAALRRFRFEVLLVIPSGIPPHKLSSVQASAADRLAMLRAAFPQTARMRIWEGEIEKPGYSYTIDTLDELHRRYPARDIYYIIGSDNLREIKTWNRYAEILASAVLCVTHRPGFPLKTPRGLARARIVTFPSPEARISSSRIRRAITRHQPWKRLVPPAVAAYIREYGLYGATAAHSSQR